MSGEWNDFLRELLDNEENRLRERIQYLEAKFGNDPESDL